MCGKFTQMVSWRQVVDFSRAATAKPGDGDGGGGDSDGGPDTEEAKRPVSLVSVVHLNDDGERIVTPMRWGLPAAWDGDPKAPPKHIHARAETIDRLPAFQSAFRSRRGIVLASTFNAGKKVGHETEQYVITPRDGQPVAIAFIFEKARFEDEDVYACVMVSAPANPLIAPIQDRMPAILQADDWEVWLGERRAPDEEVKALLVTAVGDWDLAPQAKSAKASKPRAGSGDLFKD